MRSFLLRGRESFKVDRIGSLKESWQRKERLRFIDAKLFWTGSIRRDDICRTFDIHVTNASKDIQIYIREAGQNLVYDKNDKIYRASPDFVPISRAHEVGNLLSYADLNLDWSGIPAGYLECIALPVRTPRSTITRNLLVTMLDNCGVEIVYRSMSHPRGVKRGVHPKHMIFDGFRWHVRAYDERSGEYRDFNLSRISSIGARFENSIPDDRAWSRLVDVHLAPHPKLTADQARMIEYDYEMRQGRLKITTRVPLAKYLVRSLNLDTDLQPPRQQIICTNLDALELEDH